MKAYKFLLNNLIVLLTVTGFISCTEETYTKVDDLFQPRMVAVPTVESNSISMVWYEVNDAVSYTVELHRDNYYKSLFMVFDTKDPYVSLSDLPYGTQFYIRIRSNATDTVNNSTWAYTNALTEPRPAFASLLQKVSRSEIFENSVTIHWTVDPLNPVDSISLEPLAAENSVISRSLTEEEIQQGWATVEGLEKSSIYNVNVYDNNKPGKYDKPYNQITFRTAGPAASSIIVDREDDLSAILLANDLDASIPDGTEYYLPAGSFYKVTTFKMHKGFKLVGEMKTGLPKANIEQIGWWDIVSGSYIYDFGFENIDFYQTLASQYFFNSGTTWEMENVSFLNCKFSTFQRGFWRHQGANLAKHIVSFTMDECTLDKCGAGNSYGTFSIRSNGDDNLESVIITNCTFMRENVAMPNVFEHKYSEYPIHLEFRNVTFYNYCANKQMIMLDNNLNSEFVFEKVLIASPAGKIYTITASTTTSFADNYTTTDYLLGPSAVEGTELGVSATDLFTDPVNGDLTIKDPNSPIVINRVGDLRWLK